MAEEKPKLKFTRRIISLANLQQIEAEVKEKNMITGSSMHMVVSDLIKLRMLCMAMKASYKNGDEAGLHDALQKLEMIV